MRIMPITTRFRSMMEDSADMLRDSLDAFVRSDAAVEREICRRDDRVDRANRRTASLYLMGLRLRRTNKL
jgi:phosphate uptake regulator